MAPIRAAAALRFNRLGYRSAHRANASSHSKLVKIVDLVDAHGIEFTLSDLTQVPCMRKRVLPAHS